MPKKDIQEWGVKEYLQEYEELLDERRDIDVEARRISSYLLPGRGMFNNLERPAKRKFTSPRVVNPAGKEALKILSAGIHGWLTSPSRPWFRLQFTNPQLKKNPVLSRWMYEVNKTLYDAFSASNFYQCVHSFYNELGGFGTGSLYFGEDGDPFRFEGMTFGEYAIGLDSRGIVNRFYRPVFKKGQHLIDDYRDKLPESFIKKAGNVAFLNSYFTTLEATVPRIFQKDKRFTRVLYLLGQGAAKSDMEKAEGGGTLLRIEGFYEFPYPTARWEIVGSDIYGTSPGIEALPDIMRLQEMEKSASMAVHKDVSPPLFAPAHLKGKIKGLPGGVTYSRNTMNEKVTSLYDKPFNYQGVSAFVERVEQRLQRTFYNDIFLSIMRDPNASPLRTGEVNVKDQEKMIRIGPVVERLYHEFYKPIIERGFNILLRKGMLPPLDPALQEMVQASSYDVSLISVLAQAQKALGTRSIQDFFQFTGAVASVDQKVLDKVNSDAAIDEYADMTGVPSIILRSDEEVASIRQARAQELQKAQKQQQQMAQVQAENATIKDRASAARDMSSAGVNISDVFGGGNA